MLSSLEDEERVYSECHLAHCKKIPGSQVKNSKYVLTFVFCLESAYLQFGKSL